MTKKTLIIIVIILSIGIVLGGFGIVYLLTKSSDNTAQTPPQNAQPHIPEPDFYTLSINEFEQNVTGELTADGKVTNLDDISKVNHYGLVSFNTSQDIMWFQCAQGYEVTSFTSSTGNNAVKIDPEVNIEITQITAGLHNNLTVVCTKIKK